MNMEAFYQLCDILGKSSGLRSTQCMLVEEQITRFLHILGNDSRNRFISWIHRRYLSTTTRSFHRILRIIIRLKEHYFSNL